MNPDDVRTKINQVFQDIFEDPQLQISNATTADDIEGWDSLTHIDLIVAVEKTFKIKLSTGEVRGLKNVGDFIALVAKKAL